jgi:hypothetical protein
MELTMRITNQNAQEFEVHKWYADASELQLPPGGRYPARFETSLGNGQPFEFHHFDGNGTAVYMQGNGCLTFNIFND